MTKPCDWQAREAGRKPDVSCIVQAPAGSGKTELLTQRMLSLLARAENPEEVVAITFTRKAAAEMNHRLLCHLLAANALVGEPDASLPEHKRLSLELAQAVLQNDQARGWELLSQPGRLRIRTIDSLCFELARQLPVLSGIGGGEGVAEDADALYREAAIMTLAAIEDKQDELAPHVARILQRYDNKLDRQADLLAGMLANREQWLGHVLDARTDDGFDRTQLEDALRFLVESQLRLAQDTLPPDLLNELPRFLRFMGEHDCDHAEDAQSLLDACLDPTTGALVMSSDADALPHWRTLIESLLTGGGTMRRSVDKNLGFPAQGAVAREDQARNATYKADYKELLNSHAANEPLLAALNTVRKLPMPSYQDEAWESLASLLHMLLRAVVNWKLVMTEAGEVDYAEIVHRAIDALGSEEAPSDLALRMDYRIQHLLVDEFQDTSMSQVRLLQQLTTGWSAGDGRTLFLVGDPMQSIYRFRKAEVSLFIKAWQGELFEHLQLEPLRLSVNFRSTRPVVEWLNEIFAVVLPPQDDPVMGAVSYAAAETRPGVEDDGKVTINMLAERDDQQEARLVVEAIQAQQGKGKTAVLVRSRAHASAILAELDRLKESQPQLRYRAVEFTHLATTPLITDLVSLTLALQQPADRLAWLAVLRAPFVGLDLADLDALVAGDTARTIPEQFDSGYDALSDDARLRLQRTAPVLLQALELRGRQAPRSLVESVWIALGGPACVSNRAELDDADAFFGLLDALQDQGLPLDRDTLDRRLKQLNAEPDSQAGEALQVMTIHAAKGLQFDTVILPGLDRGASGDKNKLLHWFELAGEDRFVLSPMRAARERESRSSDLIDFIYTIENQRSQFEDGRLLYVAATRASRKLYLFGAAKPNNDGNVSPRAHSLLKTLWPAIEAKHTPPFAEDDQALIANDEHADADSPAFPQTWRRLAADWQPPEPPPSIKTPVADALETRDTVDFDWAGEDARLAGNLVHRVLQLIGENGMDGWQEGGGMGTAENWARQYLRQHGIKGPQADTILARTQQAVDTCLASELGRWILAEHEDAFCEYAVTTISGQHTRKLVIDRSFICDGQRWIIDYKTSSHAGGRLEEFLDSEAKRFGEQLRGYRKAMAARETLPIKTALYFPLLDRLKEVN